jgi:hypothetical protein
MAISGLVQATLPCAMLCATIYTLKMCTLMQYSSATAARRIIITVVVFPSSFYILMSSAIHTSSVNFAKLSLATFVHELTSYTGNYCRLHLA